MLALCSISASLAQSKVDKVFEHNGTRCEISKLNCLKADFDGNGIDDYSAPMGEGQKGSCATKVVAF
jgi:hypothetical protein